MVVLVILILLWLLLTDATSLDSQIFKDFARHSMNLRELTIRCAMLVKVCLILHLTGFVWFVN